MPQKKKLKVALIFGGTSEERKVSLQSAKNIVKNLDKAKYQIVLVEIKKDGKVQLKKIAKADVAFVAIHGPGGEDGTIQGFLELIRIPYTGSGILASSLAMDKVKTKSLIATHGVNVARHTFIRKNDYRKKHSHILKNLKIPCVVKPNRIGSSIGTTVVKTRRGLGDAVKNALLHDNEVIVEDYLAGTELTVPVLGNNNPKALPVIQIIPKVSDFFDYKAKYETGGSDELVPAPIPKSLTKKLQKIAIMVHEVLGCRGVTRSDFIVTADGEIFFLEINTIPGMTENSLVPKSAKAAGISYPQLLDKLIKLALEKN